jgi:sugar O-acyltransferase (sialic acid O-acetyltransferase NeuD family)
MQTEHPKRKIILAGGGGHCKAVIDVIEQEGIYDIAGILDQPEKIGEKVLGYSIVGSDDEIPNLAKDGYYFIVTVGHIKSPEIRMKIFKRIERYTDKIATIVSPSAYVSPHAKIGKGTIVMHHALINAKAFVGKNCIINTKALVEHDAVVEDNCHISTGAIINGGTVIRNGTFFGSNAVSKEYVETNDFDFIKAGNVFKGSKNE